MTQIADGPGKVVNASVEEQKTTKEIPSKFARLCDAIEVLGFKRDSFCFVPATGEIQADRVIPDPVENYKYQTVNFKSLQQLEQWAEARGIIPPGDVSKDAQDLAGAMTKAGLKNVRYFFGAGLRGVTGTGAKERWVFFRLGTSPAQVEQWKIGERVKNAQQQRPLTGGI